jgi:REP element-mobilizing transposase RayT
MNEHRSNHNITYVCRYHVVFCPKYRRKVLTPPIDERLKTILMEQIERWGQELIEQEVMPDHVHVLLTSLRDNAGWPFPLVDILQCCKSATAHRINRLLDVAGPIWEEESFDHVLRSQESFGEKCEYIRHNAVKGGLVSRPEDYGWL